MRKFLLPIINLVNLILISVAWGISNHSGAVIDAAENDMARGTLYDIVWMGSKANVIGIVAFFLFIVGCALTLIAFLPVKWRKFVSCGAGAAYIASGVLFLLSPKTYSAIIVEPKLGSAFIAFCVLVLIAGAFSCAMAVIEFLGKKESK